MLCCSKINNFLIKNWSVNSVNILHSIFIEESHIGTSQSRLSAYHLKTSKIKDKTEHSLNNYCMPGRVLGTSFNYHSIRTKSYSYYPRFTDESTEWNSQNTNLVSDCRVHCRASMLVLVKIRKRIFSHFMS